VTDPHEVGGGVPAIRQQDDATGDQGQHCTQLLDAHFDGGLLGADAPLIKHAHPTTSWLLGGTGQEHQRRKLVAHTHRFSGMFGT
jgi:hypothetical protein